MTEEERKECVGRICLWWDAMRECGVVLAIAARAGADVTQRFPPLPPVKPDGTQDGIPSVDPDGQPFPTWEESRQIAASLPLYAAVLFCQFDGNGRADKGAVAANGAPMNRVRADVIARAFPTPEGLARYMELANLVTNARNQKIAHAQGTAFRVTHGPGSISWHPRPELPDLAEWLGCVKALELAMHEEHAKLSRLGPSQ